MQASDAAGGEEAVIGPGSVLDFQQQQEDGAAGDVAADETVAHGQYKGQGGHVNFNNTHSSFTPSFDGSAVCGIVPRWFKCFAKEYGRDYMTPVMYDRRGDSSAFPCYGALEVRGWRALRMAEYIPC